jgi:hypothetical protein
MQELHSRWMEVESKLPNVWTYSIQGLMAERYEFSPFKKKKGMNFFFVCFCSSNEGTRIWLPAPPRFHLKLSMRDLPKQTKSIFFQTCLLECYWTESVSMTETFMWSFRNHSRCSSSFSPEGSYCYELIMISPVKRSYKGSNCSSTRFMKQVYDVLFRVRMSRATSLQPWKFRWFLDN